MPGRELINGWLKAGYVESDFFHETESATPQSGVTSPYLLYIALNGLQDAVGPTYGYVRYADDFIVCARSSEELEAAKLTIEEWLRPRELQLNAEKTKIVHVNDGFNVLGFCIRRYKGKRLVSHRRRKCWTSRNDCASG
jgi:RNA-directed DNA polymerase